MQIGRKLVAIIMSSLFLTLTSCQSLVYESPPILLYLVIDSSNLIATIRPLDVGTDYVSIDEQALALASNPAVVSVFCDSIIASINEQRAAAGLSLFTKSIDLCAAASVRAQEQEQKFSHSRPDGSEFWTVDSRYCYGECLSRGYTPNEVVTAWMNSPTHRSILMDTGFKTAGIGVYDENGQCFIALEVGY